MLGEKIGEYVGKNTGRRVIPNDEHGPKMEISMEQVGKMYGVEVVDYGTYDAVMVGKHLEGKGQGITMTKDGESLTWNATEPGAYHVEVWIKPRHLVAALGTQAALADTEYLWFITNPIRVLP